MKKNKGETPRIAASVLKIPEPIVARVYDETSRMITDNGKFNRLGLAVLSRSFVETNMVPAEPELSAL